MKWVIGNELVAPLKNSKLFALGLLNRWNENLWIELYTHCSVASVPFLVRFVWKGYKG